MPEEFRDILRRHLEHTLKSKSVVQGSVESERIENPFQELAKRINESFGGTLSDSDSLYNPSKLVITQRFDDSVIWKEVFATSTEEEKTMLSHTFHWLSRVYGRFDKIKDLRKADIASLRKLGASFEMADLIVNSFRPTESSRSV